MEPEDVSLLSSVGMMSVSLLRVLKDIRDFVAQGTWVRGVRGKLAVTITIPFFYSPAITNWKVNS